MATNLFDRTTYPTVEPERLVAGERWAWRRDDLATLYPPASYSLHYHAREHGGGGANEVTFSATEALDTYLIEVSSSSTADYPLGHLHWQAWITRTADSEQVRVSEGIWEIIGDYDDNQTDPRSTADLMVSYLETTLQELAQKHAQSYSIADRQMVFADMRKTREELNYWKAEYRKEVKRTRRAAGKPTGDVIATRFSGLG